MRLRHLGLIPYIMVVMLFVLPEDTFLKHFYTIAALVIANLIALFVIFSVIGKIWVARLRHINWKESLAFCGVAVFINYIAYALSFNCGFLITGLWFPSIVLGMAVHLLSPDDPQAIRRRDLIIKVCVWIGIFLYAAGNSGSGSNFWFSLLAAYLTLGATEFGMIAGEKLLSPPAPNRPTAQFAKQDDLKQAGIIDER